MRLLGFDFRGGVADLEDLFGGCPADSRFSLKENRLIDLQVLLCVVNELHHALLYIIHLEDLSSRGSLLLVLCHQLAYELLQLWAVTVRNRPWCILDDLENKSEQVVRFEGLLQRAELIEDDAQRPYIALRRIGLALARLRRHVVRSADNRHGHRLCRFEDLTNAKVT